jgi:hypothetical protein
MSRASEDKPYPGSSISFRDGLHLSLEAGKNVDLHWSQFYAFLFALLAWLTSNLGKLSYKEAAIVSIATAAFFSLNGIATIRAYILLGLITEETTHIARQSDFLSPNVRRFAASKRNRMALPLRIPIAALAHIIAAAAIIYLAWRGGSV